ncbi:NTE family protein [Aneurinibacillus soli]|uniref:Patatin-like phospholipase n=1 Tax=Aneurinibacillus soli TaxID=1500254 RepID=A0A0U5B271_9BACL|nr:patatin-like phospholipase family protein [Aneurinibacillus soli]PYE63660.1 NTE family protein [Aneurinibacillus soli]BAU27407.1 Patatin-like phospholipase [Aneurinibacillus soli]
MVKIDAVFEGGGVKGIAFVGAVTEFERCGYTFCRVAGTSAGSIIASLIAAGYRAPELAKLMQSFDYRALQQKQGLARIPVVGTWLNLCVKKGMYSADYLQNWMQEVLAKQGIYTFGDLPEGKLKVIVSDITDAKLLVLPDDAHRIGYKPDELPIPLAVRMSASIPIYFEPVIVYDRLMPVYVVDGGILSNFPLWIFGDDEANPYPTIGFRLHADSKVKPYPIDNLRSYIHAILRTMIQAHDQRYVEQQHAARTVFIPTNSIASTQFDLSKEEQTWLYESGVEAAKRFMTRMPGLRRQIKKEKTS